jgi:hypothetical protein
VIDGGHFCFGVTTTAPPDPMAVVVRGTYDGPLFWQCPACGVTWHRFPPGNPLRELAATYMRWISARPHTSN